MKLNSLVVRILDSFGAFEKVSDRTYIGQYTKNIECCSSELALLFDNGHEIVCDACNIYLYPNSVLASFPKGKYTKMLFYLLEEQLYLLSLFVGHCDVLSFDCKVFRKEGERHLRFRRIVNYPPLLRWVVGLYQLVSQSYDLMKQHFVIPIQQIIYRYDFILEMLLRSGDKHRTDALNSIQYGKVNLIVGKLLKDLIIPVRIVIRHIAQFSILATETEMVSLAFDGINDRSNLPEAVTACRLSENHDKKLQQVKCFTHLSPSCHYIMPAKTLLGRKLTS